MSGDAIRHEGEFSRVTVTSHRSRLSVGHFLWHLLQMVLAMAVGMAIFTVLFRALLTPAGHLTLRTATPFLWFAGMAVFMTVPMVALMRYYQAHSWRQCAEMTGAMLVPPGAVAALVQFGMIADPWLAVSTLETSTHVTMMLGMIGWMFYRRDQYAGTRIDVRHDRAAGEPWRAGVDRGGPTP